MDKKIKLTKKKKLKKKIFFLNQYLFILIIY